MDLSIIIVNWNSKDFLRRCLDSIATEPHPFEWEVLVVDSGSRDGCDLMLKEEFPSVRFFQAENIGFARSNNLAFAQAKGEFVLFLNPDTEMAKGALDSMFSAIQRLPQAGVVGCKLLNTDGTIQSSCIKAFPSLLNQMLDTEFLQKLFPRAKLWGMAALHDAGESVAEVDVISGACMLLRRDIFKQLGMFTEAYFMYSEDVDLCFKSKAAGHKNYFVPKSVVVHHGGASSAQTTTSSFSSVLMLESRWRFFRRTRSEMYAWLYRIEMTLVCFSRIMLAVLSSPLGLIFNRFARWKQIIGKWYPRLRWTLGLEVWAKRL